MATTGAAVDFQSPQVRVKNRPQKKPPAALPRRSLTRVLQSTGVSRAVLIAYCEYGIIPFTLEELQARGCDDDFIQTVRRIEFLREHHGINLAGIRIIAELMREVERLREELRFRANP